VIPHLPNRQWALSVPKRLRPFLHQTPEVASAVLGIFLRALRSALRDASPGVPVALRDAHLGAISFPQRFGSSLSSKILSAAGAKHSHYHHHVLALDGVISVDRQYAACFHEATGLDARDAEALARTVQVRVLRWFTRRGLLDPSTAADMRTWRGTGGCFASSMLRVFDGSIDGSVRIEGEDRAGLERLVRSCARGPLALGSRWRWSWPTASLPPAWTASSHTARCTRARPSSTSGGCGTRDGRLAGSPSSRSCERQI
jgi:hypothetical protein